MPFSAAIKSSDHPPIKKRVVMRHRIIMGQNNFMLRLALSMILIG